MPKHHLILFIVIAVEDMECKIYNWFKTKKCVRKISETNDVFAYVLCYV